MKRRQFFLLGVGTTGAIVLAPYLTGQARQLLASRKAFSQVYSSKDGLLAVDLEASYARLNLGGKTAYLMSYNGQVPGPRLEAKPGDTVRINFTNNLPQPTNLHYHGLHIPPTGTADNVFLKIPRGEGFTYEFTIPKNHPAGTFWYHPHVHGFVADQVFGGLSGLFVVRGDLDEIPEIKAAKEEFLVLKDFDLDNNGRIIPPSEGIKMTTGRTGRSIAVNNRFNPTLSIPKGGLLRLRILNASASRIYRLAIQEHPFYIIATDGGAISEPVEVKELPLIPGERVEVLIRGDREPGQYRLLNLPPKRGEMGMMRGNMMCGDMMNHGMMCGGMSEEYSTTLATVTYSGSVPALPLPDQLIPIEALPEPQRVRRFEFSHEMVRGLGMAFLINGKMFEGDRIDTRVRLNTVEDWELVNLAHQDHPFHVHVNQFQVISRNGKQLPYLAWKDVVSVAPGETVRCRQRFEKYAGKTVYHCHILDHEDLGMMGILELLGYTKPKFT